jgi:uncharacterized protein YodC (DUF2158 family)
MTRVSKGETVMLASGGPKMTVKEVDDKRYDSAYRTHDRDRVCTVSCVWFDTGNEVREEDFDIELLVKA